MACRNPELARLRAAKRQDLIQATERELRKVADMVAAGKLSGRDKIGVRVGKVIGKYKVGKHLILISRMRRSLSASMRSALQPKLRSTASM